MPASPHMEHHFTATATVRDVVIGMSDGLTVPFALAAGLSGAVASTGIVVVAGLAEIAAGAIAMGLGGYLAAKTDLEHYRTEREREYRETREMPEAEEQEVAAVFRQYGLEEGQIAPVVKALRSNPDRWVDFMMRHELGLEEPDPQRAPRSALTIGLSYVVGGLIPLAPYMVAQGMRRAFWLSVVFTLTALFAFGAYKGTLTGIRPLRGASQTVVTGGLAAGAAFLIAKMIG